MKKSKINDNASTSSVKTNSNAYDSDGLPFNVMKRKCLSNNNDIAKRSKLINDNDEIMLLELSMIMLKRNYAIIKFLIRV